MQGSSCKGVATHYWKRQLQQISESTSPPEYSRMWGGGTHIERSALGLCRFEAQRGSRACRGASVCRGARYEHK